MSTSTQFYRNLVGVGNVGVGTTIAPGSNIQVSGNIYASNALQTTNVLATNVFASGAFYGNVAGSNVASFLNVYSSNALQTTNVLATNVFVSSAVYGSIAGSNVASFLNVYSANALTTTNVSTSQFLINGVAGTSGQVLQATGTGLQWTSVAAGLSQGLFLNLASTYTLGTPFFTSTSAPQINAYHINFATTFVAQGAGTVSAFSVSTGLLKFTATGLYQLTCVIAGDQPISKLAVGTSASASFGSSTTSYTYVYNYPVNSSPSETVIVPLNVTDISKYYYLDAFFVGNATQLYVTSSGSATGTNNGTFIQITPFGSYLSSATGVASALLCNCSSSSNLSGSYSSNAYRITLTTANGWTVNGTSTSLAVTPNGNFQVNQSGIYEVNMCLNTVGSTPVQFQVGSLSSDSATPGSSTAYLYTYAPMYTQDPTTSINLPINVTNTSNVYFVECSFAGTVTGNVALNQTSTFVSIKPIGGFISSATNPWTQQGTSVYYNGGRVGLGVVPTSLTETLTVSGNTSFIGNVTSSQDLSGNAYILAKRTPAGSLSVQNYVTGSVPLTTTTNLIQNYLSNAAAVVTSAPTYNPALSLPGTASSAVNLGSYHSTHFDPTSSNIFVEAWVYITTGGNQWIMASSNTTISTGEDWGFLYNPSLGTINFYVFNTSGTFSQGFATGMAQNSWYHVAASWNSVTKTAYAFVSGTVNAGSAITGSMRYFPTNVITIGSYLANTSNFLKGYIYDLRFLRGSVVPTGSFTAPATPAVFGLTAPAYVTGMSTGGSANVALSLQSQYFPGASTSPYGPCLTLPGTVGSYYQENNVFSGNPINNGFTIEAWVNYASLANSNTFFVTYCYAFMLARGSAVSGGGDWNFGICTTGQLAFTYGVSAAPYGAYATVTSGTITTGSWNHIVAQGNTAGYVNMYINGQIQVLTAQGYSPTGSGSATSLVLGGTNTTGSSIVAVGQYGGSQGPNFAVAKARVLFGANTYTTTTFTPSPNLGPVPSGGTVAWQLETQYPLPTYPYIQDVTELPQQASSYGSLPTPVGGVTSNVLSPLAGTQLQSLRFDGTGYIDYGNAASSSLTTNLWASNWTIEAWVYLPSAGGAGQTPGVLSRSSPTGTASLIDWSFYLGSGNPANVLFAYGSGNPVYNYNASTGVSVGTWTHVASTYDGTRSNVYIGGVLSNSMVATTTAMTFNPTYGVVAGGYNYGSYLFNENLADVRVSNAAIYTGSSFTVPSAPLPVLNSTLLLLRSNNQQTGTTLEVQGRGLQSTSLGATRTVQAYPPAPMSSYLLDTTSNASVSYGQGKYVASASSEFPGQATYAWMAFDKTNGTNWPNIWYTSGYNGSSPYNYTGSVVTVDTLGNAYPGEWLQIQLPVSVLLSSYSLSCQTNFTGNSPSTFVVLGSRDGTNWTLVNRQSGFNPGVAGAVNTFAVSTTQAYNYYRLSAQNLVNSSTFSVGELILNGTEEALCVTSDAKVGVGIANPQRSLEIAGDLVTGGTVSAGNPLMYRNRIINGDMRINQRGVFSNAASSGNLFIVDRFLTTVNATTGYYVSSNVLLSASDTPYQLGFTSSLRCTVAVGYSPSYIYPIWQNIEAYNMADFNWGTSFGTPVTVSFWYRSNMPSGSIGSVNLRNNVAGGTWWLYNASFIVAGGGVWQYVTLTVPPPPNGSTWKTGTNTGIELGISTINGGTSLGWSSSASAGYYGQFPWWQYQGTYVEATGVQLEKGTIATPFEVRPYATELALCQRYYQQFNCTATGGSYQKFGTGWIASTTGAYTVTPLVVPMRTNPTLASNSAPSTFLVTAVNILTVTSMSVNSASTNEVEISWTGTGGSAGQGATAAANSTTSAFLGFNAEL